MSAFTKPLTPNKSRTNLKPPTPTKSKSMSNICRSSSGSYVNLCAQTKVLEEVNVLLYLESLKRNRDSELFLRQKIEETYSVFEERRCKYFSMIAKYATLVKLASTSKALVHNNLVELPTEAAGTDIKYIKEKLSSNSATDYISATDLNKFKEMLHEMEKYKNIPIRSSELIDLQNAADAIQSSINAIEILLEKCITQSLDHFTDTLAMSNYRKLQKEHVHNE